MFSTYQSQDVTILLKDITGLVTPLGTREREARIQSGVHYSEMLPLEYEPSPAYLAALSRRPGAVRRHHSGGCGPGGGADLGEQGKAVRPGLPGPGRDAHRHSDPPAISKAGTVPTSPITPSPSFGAGASTAMPWPIS